MVTVLAFLFKTSVPMSGACVSVSVKKAISIPTDGLSTAAAGAATWPTSEQAEFGIFIYFSGRVEPSGSCFRCEAGNGDSFFRIQFFELLTKLQMPRPRAGRHNFEGFRRGSNNGADHFDDAESIRRPNIKRRHGGSVLLLPCRRYIKMRACQSVIWKSMLRASVCNFLSASVSVRTKVRT